MLVVILEMNFTIKIAGKFIQVQPVSLRPDNRMVIQEN